MSPSLCASILVTWLSPLSTFQVSGAEKQIVLSLAAHPIMEYSEGSLLLPSISPPAPSAAPASGEHKHQLRVGLLALCSTFTHMQSSSAKSGKCILLLTEKEQSTVAAVPCVPLCWHCLSQCLSLHVMLHKTEQQAAGQRDGAQCCLQSNPKVPSHPRTELSLLLLLH